MTALRGFTPAALLNVERTTISSDKMAASASCLVESARAWCGENFYQMAGAQAKAAWQHRKDAGCTVD